MWRCSQRQVDRLGHRSPGRERPVHLRRQGAVEQFAAVGNHHRHAFWKQVSHCRSGLSAEEEEFVLPPYPLPPFALSPQESLGGGWMGHSGKMEPHELQEPHGISGAAAESTSGFGSKRPLMAVKTVSWIRGRQGMWSQGRQSGGDYTSSEKRLRPRR